VCLYSITAFFALTYLIWLLVLHDYCIGEMTQVVMQTPMYEVHIEDTEKKKPNFSIAVRTSFLAGFVQNVLLVFES
jgi:hypothetical protein